MWQGQWLGLWLGDWLGPIGEAEQPPGETDDATGGSRIDRRRAKREERRRRDMLALQARNEAQAIAQARAEAGTPSGRFYQAPPANDDGAQAAREAAQAAIDKAREQAAAQQQRIENDRRLRLLVIAAMVLD